MDDSEADDIPAFVFGQVSADVVAVKIDLDGKRYDATVRNDFYLLVFPSPSVDDEAIDSVMFRLSDGTDRVLRIGA